MKNQNLLSCLLFLLTPWILVSCSDGGSGGGSSPQPTPEPYKVNCATIEGCVEIANGFQFPDGAGGIVTCTKSACTTQNALLTDISNSKTQGQAQGYADGNSQAPAKYNQGYNEGYQAGLLSGQQQRDSAKAQGTIDGYSTGQVQAQDQISDLYNRGRADGYAAGLRSSTSDSYNRGQVDGTFDGFDDGVVDGKAVGYLDGHDSGRAAGYNSGHWDGSIAGYNQGHQDGYVDGAWAGDADGFKNGHKAGYDDYYPVGYSDGYHGYSVIGKGKDTDLQKAKAQKKNLEKRAGQMAQNFGMSLESAEKMVQLSDQIRQLTQSGKMTASDRLAITNSALKIAGVTPEEVNSAMAQVLKGNFKGAKDLMDRAATNLGMENPADLQDKLLPSLGLVMP